MKRILFSTCKLIVFSLIIAMPASYFLLEDLKIKLFVIALLLTLLLVFVILVKVSKSKEKKKLTRPTAGYISIKAQVIAKTEYEKNISGLTLAFDYQGKTVEIKVIIEGCKKQIDTYLKEGNNAKIFVNPEDLNDVIIPQLAYKRRKQNDEGLFWRLFEGFFKYIVPAGMAAAIIIPLYFTFKDDLKDVFKWGNKATDFRFESLCYFKGNTETVWELYSDEGSKYKLIVKNPQTNAVITEIIQSADPVTDNVFIFPAKNKIWVIGAEAGKKPIIDAYNPFTFKREVCDTVFLNMYPQIDGRISDSYYPCSLRYYENERKTKNLVSRADERVLSFRTSHDQSFYYIFETGKLIDNEEELYWYLCLDKYNHLNPSNYYYLFYTEKPEEAHLYKSKRHFARDNTAPLDINEQGYYNNPFLSGDFKQVTIPELNKATVVYADNGIACIKHYNNKKKHIIGVYKEDQAFAEIDLSKCRNYYYLTEPEQVFTIRKSDTLLFRSKYLGTIIFNLQSKKTEYYPDELYTNANRKRFFSLKYATVHENNELYVTETGVLTTKSTRLLSEKSLKNCGIAYQQDDMALIWYKTLNADSPEYNFICVDYKGNILYTLSGAEIPAISNYDLSNNAYLENHLKAYKSGADLILVFDELGVMKINAKSGKIIWNYKPTPTN